MNTLSIILSPVTKHYQLAITNGYTSQTNVWSHVTGDMLIQDGGVL